MHRIDGTYFFASFAIIINSLNKQLQSKLFNMNIINIQVAKSRKNSGIKSCFAKYIKHTAYAILPTWRVSQAFLRIYISNKTVNEPTVAGKIQSKIIST